MKEEIERYFNSGIKKRFCDNCERGFAKDDIVFCPNDEKDDPIIRGKIFCGIPCAEAYFDKHKKIKSILNI